MRAVGNFFWCLLIGIWEALAFIIVGAILCITIIGIPFGKQCFKFASLVFLPFGRNAVTNFDKHPIANIIWAVLVGIGMAIGWFFMGAIFCITIIGIPFGKQCFKMVKPTFIPFGAEIGKIESAK